jgi:hypothetical protein
MFFKIITNIFIKISMKISSSCQIVILKYKTPVLLKKSGLPLYDDKKRREIPLYVLEFVTT